MKRAFLGVDGGGTKTRAIVVDEHGQVRGLAVGGSTNFNTLPAGQVAANLAEVIEEAAGKAGAASIEASAFGIAGVNNEADRGTFRAIVESVKGRALGRFDVVNDTVISLLGGLGGGEGAVLIAGTGSNCLGRLRSGQTWQAGGLEFIIDDGGSGYDLGRRGLVAAVRSADRRGPRSALEARLFADIDVQTAGEVPRRLHFEGPDGPGKPMTKAQVAALARAVLDVAASGDQVAQAVVRASVGELCLMVQTVVRELPFERTPVAVCVVGSVGQSQTIWRELERQLAEAQVPARLVMPRLAPVAGAALLAFELAGLAAGEGVIAALSASLPQGL